MNVPVSNTVVVGSYRYAISVSSYHCKLTMTMMVVLMAWPTLCRHRERQARKTGLTKSQISPSMINGSAYQGPHLAMLESFQEKCTQKYLDETAVDVETRAEMKQNEKLDNINSHINQMDARLIDLTHATENLKQQIDASREISSSGGGGARGKSSIISSTSDISHVSGALVTAANLGVFSAMKRGSNVSDANRASYVSRTNSNILGLSDLCSVIDEAPELGIFAQLLPMFRQK